RRSRPATPTLPRAPTTPPTILLGRPPSGSSGGGSPTHRWTPRRAPPNTTTRCRWSWTRTGCPPGGPTPPVRNTPWIGFWCTGNPRTILRTCGRSRPPPRTGPEYGNCTTMSATCGRPDPSTSVRHDVPTAVHCVPYRPRSPLHLDRDHAGLLGHHASRGNRDRCRLPHSRRGADLVAVELRPHHPETLDADRRHRGRARPHGLSRMECG